MKPLAYIEKWITEHASAAVLRDHISLLKEQMLALQNENTMMKKENADLKRENSDLKKQNYSLKEDASHNTQRPLKPYRTAGGHTIMRRG